MSTNGLSLSMLFVNQLNRGSLNGFVFFYHFFHNEINRWSELYFIIWYLFVTTIGLNICLALSGDVSHICPWFFFCPQRSFSLVFKIHEAKKKRANDHDDLIVSNMFDIYRWETFSSTFDFKRSHFSSVQISIEWTNSWSNHRGALQSSLREFSSIRSRNGCLSLNRLIHFIFCAINSFFFLW